MAPMALQKLASGFSSGGNGVEQGSPNSTRSFSESLRGFLQSIRAHTGLSTDGTSPRGSRSGHSESSRPGTPRAQQAYVPILDSLHTESDESDPERSTKWITSSAHGMLTIPAETVPSLSPSRSSIMRSFSSKRSKGPAAPVIVTSSSNTKTSGSLLSSADIPSTSRGTSASAFASGGMRLSSVSRVASRTRELLAAAAAAFNSDNASPPLTATILAALEPTTVPSTALSQRTPTPSSSQLSLPALPLCTPCVINADTVPDPTTLLCAQPHDTQTLGTVQSLILLPEPDTNEISIGCSIPGSYAFHLSTPAAPAGASTQPAMDCPAQLLMQLSSPPTVTSTVSGISGGRRRITLNSPTNNNFHVEQGGLFSTYENITSAADDGVLAPSVEENNRSERSKKQDHEKDSDEDGHGDGDGGTVGVLVADDLQPTAADCSTPVKPVKLSPVAVSQAVQRLQMRQQQERASGRFQRISGVVPGGSGGGGPVHSQYSSLQVAQNAAATAPQRPLSPSHDGSESMVCNKHGIETGAPVTLASPMTGQRPMASPRHADAASQSPSVGRRQGRRRAISGSSPFVHPYGLYNFPPAALASASGAFAPGAPQFPGGSGGSLQRTNSGADAPWEEWEVSYGSSGRTMSALEAMRNSVSYTEGQASGADRLQAMMHSAASCDEATSYLQQLLLPDNNSTASLELQYSGTQAHVAGILPYGGSSGAAYGLGGGGGVGSAARMHSETASGATGADAGLSSSLGLWTELPSIRAHNSSSRAISGIMASSIACGTSSPLSSQPMSRRPKSAVLGTSAVLLASPAKGPHLTSTALCPHAEKSATQLFEELRRSYNATAASEPAVCPPSAVALDVASIAERGPSSAEDDEHIQPLLLREQLREELEAALWRLVRAKNAEAVSFLLAADPAAKPNRPLAPLLTGMRSWVYTNMW